MTPHVFLDARFAALLAASPEVTVEGFDLTSKQ
jgi:hypothetical protein